MHLRCLLGSCNDVWGAAVDVCCGAVARELWGAMAAACTEMLVTELQLGSPGKLRLMDKELWLMLAGELRLRLD